MLQISESKENDCKEIEGKFYCECLSKTIEIVYDKKLSFEFINQAVAHFNSVYSDLISELCKYTTYYCIDTIEQYPDIEYKPGLHNLKSDLDILNYIEIDELRVEDYNGSIVLNIAGGCDWDEKGLQWIIKNKYIEYVGPWDDFRIWTPDLNGLFFNYRSKKS